MFHGKTAAEYKSLVTKLRAYMLATVKGVTEVLKEEDPEGMLMDKAQQGCCVFLGLPEPMPGEPVKFRRCRARGMEAFF